MSLDEILDSLRSLKDELELRYQVEQLAVFGSYRRGQSNPESDLDILVSFHEVPTLLQFIELENMLSDHLGLKVDLVMRDSLKPRIGKHILKEILRV